MNTLYLHFIIFHNVGLIKNPCHLSLILNPLQNSNVYDLYCFNSLSSNWCSSVTSCLNLPISMLNILFQHGKCAFYSPPLFYNQTLKNTLQNKLWCYIIFTKTIYYMKALAYHSSAPAYFWVTSSLFLFIFFILTDILKKSKLLKYYCFLNSNHDRGIC